MTDHKPRQKGLKRSEALGLLLKAGVPMEVCSEALAVLEKAGMVPPVRDANQRSQYGYARLWQWEDEDQVTS